MTLASDRSAALAEALVLLLAAAVGAGLGYRDDPGLWYFGPGTLVLVGFFVLVERPAMSGLRGAGLVIALVVLPAVAAVAALLGFGFGIAGAFGAFALLALARAVKPVRTGG
jgi:hypothetical protein